MRDAAPPPEYHYLGKLGKAFQLDGGVRFYPVGPVEEDAVASLAEVFVEGLGTARIREIRVQAGVPVLYFTRIRNRDQARAIVNAGVYADPEQLPDAQDEAFYLDDLIGLTVTQSGPNGPGVPLGEVVDVLSAGGHDVLVVRGATGEYLVPLGAPYVDIDERGVHLVDPPEGLVDG